MISALAISSDHNIILSKDHVDLSEEISMVPFAQSMVGLYSCNQGNPRMICSFSRLVTRSWMIILMLLKCRLSQVTYSIFPDLFSVPSMLIGVMGVFNFVRAIPFLKASFLSRNLPWAPQSMRMFEVKSWLVFFPSPVTHNRIIKDLSFSTTITGESEMECIVGAAASTVRLIKNPLLWGVYKDQVSCCWGDHCRLISNICEHQQHLLSSLVLVWRNQVLMIQCVCYKIVWCVLVHNRQSICLDEYDPSILS